ncbi:integrase, catalytic region, zinc finger, CCHC-type containing protein [Tanacetum coccineum]
MITWQRYWDMVIIRLGMLRSQGFTTWKDLDIKGVDLLTGSRGNNLYTLSLGDMMTSSPICLLSKASKTKSWLWHRRLSHLNFAPVRRIRTDNLTEFVNQTLREYYEKVGISHETFVTLSPQQNGVVERRNRTLIEAALTMLIYAKALLFLWAEAVATACYTQNRSIIRLVGIKRLLDDLRVTAAQVCVTAAKRKLVMFINFNEKYAK